MQLVCAVICASLACVSNVTGSLQKTQFGEACKSLDCESGGKVFGRNVTFSLTCLPLNWSTQQGHSQCHNSS
jgi:hypothetical protein